MLWLSGPSGQERTQSVGSWVVGRPLILNFKIIPHEDVSDGVNLLRLITEQLSEDRIEGDAWLYKIPAEEVNLADDEQGSSENAPVYHGRFSLNRIYDF